MLEKFIKNDRNEKLEKILEEKEIEEQAKRDDRKRICRRNTKEYRR